MQSVPPTPSPTAGQRNNSNSRLTQSFRDQKQIESFIRSNKILKIIEGVADEYVKTFRESKSPEDALAAIIVVVPFDYLDLLRNFVDLLHLAFEEPVQFLDATKYCVFGIVRDFVKQFPDSGLKSVDIAQIHVLLRFVRLPLQQSLFFDPSQNLFPSGLSVIIGILSAFTETEKLVLQSVWFCPTGCPRNKIKSESIDAPICGSCSRQMNEYTKLRSTQSYCLLRVLPVGCVQTPRVLNKVFRAISVRVRDHIHDCELSLGTRYLITGYYNYQSEAQEFVAWNLIKH